MGKIGYLFNRFKEMDKRAMFDKIDSIHEKTGKAKIGLFFDMIWCGMRYGAGYMDYDLFEMYNLTAKQRNTYITRGRNNALVKKYTDVNYLHIFENKDEFNTLFEKYIKRDWVKVNGVDKEKVVAFLEKHSVFMAKPIDSCCGKGIEKIRTADFKSTNELYDYLSAEGNNFELEELITQHPDVAAIYPDSINTARVVTIYKDGVAHIIAAYFRIGNGSFVDNFNSGGMVAPIDEVTGIVKDRAIDKNKNLYENHPATGTKIKGFQFPDWDEALKICKEAAAIVPQMAYAGWDVCFTPNGPCFVEGNEFPGYDIYQLPQHTPDKIGMWPKFQV